MSWITLDAAKARIGISCTDPSRDASVQAAINWAIATVESYCQRNFEQATYTEDYYPWEYTVYLKNWPVASLDTVSIDGENLPLDQLTYRLDSLRAVVYFDPGLTNWANKWHLRVTYTGGYPQVPDDLMQATLDVVMARYNQADDDPSKGAVKFERIDGSVSVGYSEPASTNPSDGAIKPYVGVLNRYRSERTQGVW